MKKYDLEVRAFGKALKKIREQKAFSQQRLADECDLERKTIQRIENGETGAGLHIVFAISEVLNVKPQEIFEQIDNMEGKTH